MDKKARWWKSNYSMKEKIDFLKYRIAAPKSIPYTEMNHILEVGSHQLSEVEANYCIAFVGDVMPLGGMELSISEELRAFLDESDAIVVNLEGVITEQDRFLALSHREEILDFIRGLSTKEIIINLANNHSSDFGKGGFTEQVRLLEDRGFNHLLGFNMRRVLLNQQIELHAASYWSNQDIDTSHRFSFDTLIGNPEEADIFHIFLPHWGYEMELFPRKEQVRYAEQLLGNGWDAIVGNHPHCPQVMQLVEGKLVAYSLGNFCYDNMNPNHWYGMALKLYFRCKEGMRPELTGLDSCFTFQERLGDQIIIQKSEELNYQEQRKQIRWSLPFLSDLIK